MILRIVLGRLPSEIDPQAILDARSRLERAVAHVTGLDSIIVGTRRGVADRRIEAAIATVWRDVETMSRATGIDEQDRFLGERLDLPLVIEQADHYEIIGRTFAGLPPTSRAFVRMITIRARPNEEARLMETLRSQQPRLAQLGLVASHIGRRVIGADVEAVTIGVWPSRQVIREATGGAGERPFFAHELSEWADRLRLEMYDGIEIVPILPVASGPPIYVVDDDMRIVDITASCAAALGWRAEDLVGQDTHDLTTVGSPTIEARTARFMNEGIATGEARWVVPEAGEVLIRYAARRDVPIMGRHVVLVRRWHDPAPTIADLDQAVEAAFTGRAT